MAKLVFIRHGQSEWNLENLFTGWVDVNLSEQGEREAKEAGRKLKEAGIEFDQAYTSVLTRAIKTLHFALEESGQLWIPETKSWRLNERHYGALQGKNKADAAEKYGDEQVHIWRRSYDVLPPLLDANDEGSAANDRRYAELDPRIIPGAFGYTAKYICHYNIKFENIISLLGLIGIASYFNPIIFSRFTNYLMLFFAVSVSDCAVSLLRSRSIALRHNSTILIVCMCLLYGSSYLMYRKYTLWVPYYSIFNPQHVSRDYAEKMLLNR